MYFSCLMKFFPICFTYKKFGERINALKKNGFLTDKFNGREEIFVTG